MESAGELREFRLPMTENVKRLPRRELRGDNQARSRRRFSLVWRAVAYKMPAAHGILRKARAAGRKE